MPEKKSIDKLIKTVAKLRSQNGCPWDKEQTHKTLKRYLIEESYETIDAIDSNDKHLLMEELGDVLLQVVLHAQIARENKDFTFDDICNHINKKMISRHPHVFSNTKVKNTEEVLKNWEILKSNEKPYRKELFDGIPNSLPALLKALKVSKKVARVGFEWERDSALWKKFYDEIKEFKQAIKSKDRSKQSEEFGDLLFTAVNLARWYKLDPEENLNNGTKKFITRFNKVVKMASNSKKGTNKLSPKELNTLWEKVKKEERKNRRINRVKKQLHQ